MLRVRGFACQFHDSTHFLRFGMLRHLDGLQGLAAYLFDVIALVHDKVFVHRQHREKPIQPVL